MAQTIEVFFDFASPYAYFSLNRLDALAQRHGRRITLRPILLWAVRKTFEMLPPMEDAPKGAYLLNDMERSARFYGMPYSLPDAFPISTHLAARAYYGLDAIDPLKSRPFVHSVFDAYFAHNQDISDESVLLKIGKKYGLDAEIFGAMMAGDEARAALVAANEDAVARGVWGSPFILVDDEPFFGVDRLPQIEWYLASSRQGMRQDLFRGKARMAFEDISLDIAGAVAKITVKRPQKLNALRTKSAGELVAAFTEAEENQDVRVVILTGEGRAFGAGFDLSTIDPQASSELDNVLEDHFNPLIRKMRASRLPIIAAVNGPCAGVSVGLALACDIVLAARPAYFYEPFAGIALVPDGGNTFFLPGIAGRMRAMAAMLLGGRISAEEALSWGLVWEVHEAEELLAAADEAAARIAKLSPAAVAATKRLVGAASEKGLDAQLDLERDLQGELGRSPDMQEAVAAFVNGSKAGQ